MEGIRTADSTLREDIVMSTYLAVGDL